MRRPRHAPYVLVLAAVILAGALATAPTPDAQAAPPAIVLRRVATLPKAVVMATRSQTGVTYVGTQDGRVYMLRPGMSPKLALDIRSLTRAKAERGFLGLAFHPTLPYAYVNHTSVAGNSKIAEYKINADGTLRRSSRRLVLYQSQPFANHNGGNIVFGPDGYMYIGFGDGGSAGDPRRYALKLNTILGKIIRIDPRPTRSKAYRIPTDNPFYNVKNARKEIWAVGFRNPWRFDFDSLTNDLWIADVGQGDWEEIDFAPAAAGAAKGKSFGWSAYEGTHRYNGNQPAGGHEAPVYEYDHQHGCSVTGGLVYRGSAVPGLQGVYLFADFCSGIISGLTLDGGGHVAVTQLATVDHPSSFGVDASGEAYVLSLDGGVYRIDAG